MCFLFERVSLYIMKSKEIKNITDSRDAGLSQLDDLNESANNACSSISNEMDDFVTKAKKDLAQYGVNIKKSRTKKDDLTALSREEQKRIAIESVRADRERVNGGEFEIIGVNRYMHIAKDKSEYEDYDSFTGDGYRVYKARRIGEHHINKGIVCQDYCLYKNFDNALLLICADGVGSSSRSDIGSSSIAKAVDYVVSAVLKGAQTEEIVIEKLYDMKVMQLIINKYRSLVYDDIKSRNEEITDANVLKYATNLAFALVTENYIFAISVGDCQILMFNDSFAVKHRDHGLKESQATKSVINPYCVNEDFIVNCYDRHLFDGVLLTTDGIYDYLAEHGPSKLYEYAIQAKNRFEEKGEPYLPFCFDDKDEQNIGMFDVGNRKKQDDNSIVLAVFDKVDNDKIEATKDIINYIPNCTRVDRVGSNNIVFITKTEPKIYKALAYNSDCVNVDALSLTYAKSIPYIDELSHNHFCYRTYDSFNGMVSLERLFSENNLVLDSNHILFYGGILRSIVTTARELDAQGLCFSKDSNYLIYVDRNRNLNLLPGAIVKKENDNNLYGFSYINQYFSRSFGYIEYDNLIIPIIKPFDGKKHYVALKGINLFAVSNENGKYFISHINDEFVAFNDITLTPGQAIEIEGDFKLIGRNGNCIFTKGVN